MKSSRRSETRVRPIVKAFLEAVDDAARLKITKRAAAALRKWGAARGDRAPRWLPRMQKALSFVAAATEVHGRQRYDILVEAAKIVVALREPRDHRLVFQRSEWFLEVAIGKLGDCAGCLAMGASTADKQLSTRVKSVVNKADPIGLLRMGAPDDEYHPEIDEIACRLPEPECRTVAQTHTMVHRVFVRWFSASIAGPRGAYRKLAAALHPLRPRARARAKPVKQPTRDEALRLAREVVSTDGETMRKLAKRARRLTQEMR